jgi:hypothetical protein
MRVTVSDFVSGYLLAPDIVPVSDGNSREYSLVSVRQTKVNTCHGLTGLQSYKRLYSNSFQG